MAASFRERARREALRYGSDPWVFVRELLQNARDAGAESVWLTTEETPRETRIVCRDDGAGMSFDHARRYLFALYASSKEGDAGAAGRFGVGFWSVLRFEPGRIVVRSWPRRGDPWEVGLDGDLTTVARRVPPSRDVSGTEIVLESRGQGGHLARRVRDAAWQSGRFLRRRGNARRGVSVHVNGELVSEPFELPAPSLTFHRGRHRGAVGLGPEARTELFASGLRVRSAAALEDLLGPHASAGRTRVRFPTLARGVAPQAILDGEGLELLLARADVREDRALRRLVARAQRELQRLVERQLDAVRPRAPWRRVGALVAAAVAAAALLAGLGRLRGPAAERVVAPLLAPDRQEARSPAAYRDLTSFYRGPRSETLTQRGSAVALRYAPRAAPLHFSALVLQRPLEPPPSPLRVGPARRVACGDGCVDVALWVADGPGPIRLPVPTGHRLDTSPVRLDGQPLDVGATPAGEPVVTFARPMEGVVRYRTGKAPSPRRRPAWSAPEPRLSEIAARLRGMPPEARVAEALDWVRRRIVYSTARETAERHRAAMVRGEGFLERALTVGAGDCDVQNAVLTLLLQASGLDARLAVGYVGVGGAVLAPLHAWVEVTDTSSGWRVADASRPAPGLPQTEQEHPVDLEVRTASLALHARSPPEAGTRAPGGGAVPMPIPWLPLAVSAAAVLSTVALVLWRWRPVVRLAPQQELAPLLRGALEQPEAFRHVPAVFERPLIPVLGRRLLSLGEAWDLAGSGRLFRSARASPLAQRAAADGAAVLDTRRTEARAVADSLGGVDLDDWHRFLARARIRPLLAAVNARLRSLGEPYEVQAVSGLDAPAVLDLPSGGGITRIVVVDDDATWLAAADDRFHRRPREAVFTAVERLTETLGVRGEARVRLLRPLAREALREAVR